MLKKFPLSSQALIRFAKIAVTRFLQKTQFVHSVSLMFGKIFRKSYGDKK